MGKPFIKVGSKKLALTCPQCKWGNEPIARRCKACIEQGGNAFEPLPKYRDKITTVDVEGE